MESSSGLSAPLSHFLRKKSTPVACLPRFTTLQCEWQRERTGGPGTAGRVWKVRIDLNAPVPGWFLVLIVALLFATMVGACVADRVKDYRAGRLTDPSRLPSRPRLNNLNDDGCLGLGFF